MCVVVGCRKLAGGGGVGHALCMAYFCVYGHMILIICAGFIHEFKFGFVQNATPPIGTVPGGITLLLILKAFSSSCSSLTGLETISNAVPVIREPQQRSAIKTYIALGTITGVTLWDSLIIFMYVASK
jgi:amino acid transporter